MADGTSDILGIAPGAPGEPRGYDEAAAAREAGLEYVNLPVAVEGSRASSWCVSCQGCSESSGAETSARAGAASITGMRIQLR